MFIQLDNTYKENKNQFVFAFMAYLVETSVFDEVSLFFIVDCAGCVPFLLQNMSKALEIISLHRSSSSI